MTVLCCRQLDAGAGAVDKRACGAARGSAHGGAGARNSRRRGAGASGACSAALCGARCCPTDSRATNKQLVSAVALLLACSKTRQGRF